MQEKYFEDNFDEVNWVFFEKEKLSIPLWWKHIWLLSWQQSDAKWNEIQKFVNKTFIFVKFALFWTKMPSLQQQKDVQMACKQDVKLDEDKYPRYALF